MIGAGLSSKSTTPTDTTSQAVVLTLSAAPVVLHARLAIGRASAPDVPPVGGVAAARLPPLPRCSRKAGHMRTTDTVAQTAARELSDAFVIGKRPGGEAYISISDKRAAWIPEGLARRLHVAVDGRDPRLPNDWVFETSAGAASNLSGYTDPLDDDVAHEIAEGLIDTNTADVFRWAADHGRNRDLIAEAAEEFGMPEAGHDIEREIQAGQYLGIRRIVECLQEIIRERADEIDDSGAKGGVACDHTRLDGDGACADCGASCSHAEDQDGQCYDSVCHLHGDA